MISLGNKTMGLDGGLGRLKISCILRAEPMFFLCLLCSRKLSPNPIVLPSSHFGTTPLASRRLALRSLSIFTVAAAEPRCGWNSQSVSPQDMISNLRIEFDCQVQIANIAPDTDMRSVVGLTGISDICIYEVRIAVT
jgi:hypothetical protein